jgi:hypothetical protein
MRIAEIRHLPPAEQEQVVFVQTLETRRPWSGEKLTEYEKKTVETTDPAEAQRLDEQIVAGFSGDEPGAENSAAQRAPRRRLSAALPSPILPSMTATEIIREIDCLRPAELAEVVRHTKELDKRRPLSGAELTELARLMVDASDPSEADRLQEALVKGFYGEA